MLVLLDHTTHVDWLTEGLRNFSLPATFLPPLIYYATNYRVPYDRLPELALPHHQHPPQPHPHHEHFVVQDQPPPPPPPFNIKEAFRQMSLNMNQRLDAIEQRKLQDFKDTSRALRLIYVDYYARGSIPPGSLHPT